MNEFGLISHYFGQQPALLPAGHPDSLLPSSSTAPHGNALAGGGSPAAACMPQARNPVLLGIGDDCALLRPLPPGWALAVSSDMLLEGRHFFAGTDPVAIGHKALAVNLSDLAAMGAWPLAFTLALALPAVDPAWLAGFRQGLLALASRAACPLVGGDTTRGPLTISITVMGAVPAGGALRRDGARPGDQLWVSGPLGAAALAVAQRAGGGHASAAAAERLDWPLPRFDVGLQLAGLASAAMDLSDGLAGDLSHLLQASAACCGQPLGARLLAEQLPLADVLAEVEEEQARQHALHGGDDYELLFTAPPHRQAKIQALCPTARMIGQIHAGNGMLLADRFGNAAPVPAKGHDHFA